MANERVVSLTVTVEATPATTHFGIRYSVPDSQGRPTTWLGFSLTDNTGATTDDLAVALLSSAVYTLDGLNSPVGNEAAASRAGNYYQIRLKSASGYGNWSQPFVVEDEPDDDGPLASVADVVAALGEIIPEHTLNSNDKEAQRIIGGFLTDAMDEMRLDSTIDGLYTGTRTARQGRLLKRCEARYAGADCLEREGVLKVLGLHAPVLMEESENIREWAETLRARAERMLAQIVSGSATVTTPFAKPAVSSSTFSHASGDRTPSERISLLDERDDISSSDEESG